jgi:hypothetical protein
MYLNDPGQVRLRAFSLIARELVALLDLTGLPYGKEWVERRLRTIEGYTKTFYMVGDTGDAAKIKNRVYGCWQNHTTMADGTVILLDGPASTPLPPPIEGYSPAECLWLLRQCREGEKINKRPLAEMPADLTTPDPRTNWSHKGQGIYVPICKATLRPWSIDRTSGEHWLDVAVKVYGCNESQLLSCHARYIDYVNRYNTYPTKEQFLKFLYDYHGRTSADGVRTLPAAILHFIDHVVDSYTDVGVGPGGTVSVAEFKKITNKGQTIMRRKQMEEKKDSSDFH